MARFDDFTQHEKRVIREAMTGAQSEFYDPGHTKEDRDTLEALIREIKGDDLPFTFGGEPAEEPKKPQEPAQDARQEAPERREVYTPTRTRTSYRAPTEAATGGRPWGVTRSRQEAPPRMETGFLLIKCAHCGDVHAFCAKQPITTYRCRKCGHHTPLTDMHPLRVMCECGSKFNYRTNIVTQQMDVNCFKCGCPVPVEWQERRGRYEPIDWDGTRKGRRRKRPTNCQKSNTAEVKA